MKSKKGIFQLYKSEKFFKKENYTSKNRTKFRSTLNLIGSEIENLNESVLVLTIEYQSTLNLNGFEFPS